MGQNHNQDSPAFVRWTDHLTGKSCTLRVDADDADAPLRRLVSKYLEASDPGPLVAGRNLLTDDVGSYQTVQDVTLVLSDDGVPGTLVPGRCSERDRMSWISRRFLPPVRPSWMAARSGCSIFP